MICSMQLHSMRLSLFCWIYLKKVYSEYKVQKYKVQTQNLKVCRVLLRVAQFVFTFYALLCSSACGVVTISEKSPQRESTSGVSPGMDCDIGLSAGTTLIDGLLDYDEETINFDKTNLEFGCLVMDSELGDQVSLLILSPITIKSFLL